MAKKKIKEPVLKLECCDKCPHCYQSRYYTADSWEYIMAWNCKHPDLKCKSNPTTDHHEWCRPPGITLHESFDPIPVIPEWCPLKK